MLYEICNFAFCYGCTPATGIRTDSKMVKTVSDALINGYSRDSLICEIPALFTQLEGEDNNFEFTASSSVMTVNLFYSWNTAIETIGVIFLNTEILDRS